MYLMIKEQLVLIKTHFSEDQKYNFGHLTQSFTVLSIYKYTYSAEYAPYRVKFGTLSLTNGKDCCSFICQCKTFNLL